MKPTQRQQEIIDLMKVGFRLLTTEGKDYTCWLRSDCDDVMNIPVNRRTCESMASKGLIVPETNGKTRFFEWKLK